MTDFIIADNPDRSSKLPYLLRLPLEAGLWLKAAAVWPRDRRVYCHPLDGAPCQELAILERVAVIACTRRGTAIDLVLRRGHHRRSQFVFTTTRGRPIILWQTPQAARSARPRMRIPRGAGGSPLAIFVDSRERYPYMFAEHKQCIERCSLHAGDYAVKIENDVIAVVERKTFKDFVTSLVDGTLSFALTELASYPRSAVIVESPYADVLRHPYTGAGLLADLLARILVRYPTISINFVDSRKAAEEWTYRYLGAAYACAASPDLFERREC